MSSKDYAYAEYQAYLNAIQRNKAQAYCKECGDLKFLPNLNREQNKGKDENGNEIIVEHWYVSMSPCKCRMIQAAQRAAAESGTTQTVKVKLFDNFKTDTPYHKAMADKARQFLTDYKNRWYVVCGQSGCGKTHICTALTQEFLKQGKQVIYMRWIDDVRQIKKESNSTEVIQRLKKCSILYIDDLFKGEFSDFDFNITFEILNYRYSEQLTTIISTERSRQQLIDIDQALAGRISEMAGKYLINVSEDKSKNMRFGGF